MYFPGIMRSVLEDCRSVADSSSEVPVAATIALESRIVSKSTNQVESSNNPLYHAEFLAILSALRALDSKYLNTASLYVSMEPCSFCASALARVRIKEIFFGAYDPKEGGIYHNSKIFETSIHKPEQIIGGIMETEFSTILKEFFRKLRSK
jgi:tRNA(Arg) A34 adenosine deaminase TadA